MLVIKTYSKLYKRVAKRKHNITAERNHVHFLNSCQFAPFFQKVAKLCFEPGFEPLSS